MVENNVDKWRGEVASTLKSLALLQENLAKKLDEFLIRHEGITRHCYERRIACGERMAKTESCVGGIKLSTTRLFRWVIGVGILLVGTAAAAVLFLK